MNMESKVTPEAKADPAPKPAVVQPAAASPAPAQPEPKRKMARGTRVALMLSVPAILLVGGIAFWLTGGRWVGTEDANLHQARVAISAAEPGQVTEVNFTNDHAVKKGAVLFQIDQRPFKLALASANASLAQARLQVEQLKAAYASAQTQVKTAQENESYTSTQLDRQKALAAKGVAATSALDDAQHAYDTARTQVDTAKQQVLSALAALGGKADLPTDQHPAVLTALAARDAAEFNLSQTTVLAPADGIVYQAASFKQGQYVSTGATLFTLVETQDVWVEADYKETQLTQLKDGQKAKVTFDLYPDHSFDATVTSVGAGTGAEFSLIPAENATGNWVKVTQRIPVYLKIDNPDPNLPLRSGMSASVSVDTTHSRTLADLIP